MEQWNKLVELVKEFYIAFGQQEFLEKGMTDERMELREKLFDEELKEYKGTIRVRDSDESGRISLNLISENNRRVTIDNAIVITEEE